LQQLTSARQQLKVNNNDKQKITVLGN